MQIKELILETNSISRTRLFYHRTLEMDILDEGEDYISFKAGRTKLSFREQKNDKPFYHFAFNITNNRFSESFEWIGRKLDILPVNEEMFIAAYDNWNAQAFYFLDNNGSILEFIVRFDLPYYAPAGNTSFIEEVSEIGIVTRDAAETAALLHEEFRVPYFDKGPRLPDFVALGDDRGLLLVCQEKRGWVPTHRPAQAFPLTIIDENGRTISF